VQFVVAKQGRGEQRDQQKRNSTLALPPAHVFCKLTNHLMLPPPENSSLLLLL